MKRAMPLAFLVLALAAVIIFVSCGAPQARDISSAKSGDWSSGSTWGGGNVPGAGDTVTIKSGHTVLYDVLNDAVLGDLRIDGILRFSRETNTRFRTNGNILVRAGGYLDIGTAADPIPKTIKAEVIWVLTQAQADKFVGGPAMGEADTFEPTDMGLIAMPGSRWEVHGAPLMRTWSKLARDTNAGDYFVIVANDVTDWYHGGNVVLSSTSNPRTDSNLPSEGKDVQNNSDEHEVHSIEALEKFADGKTKITLNKSLKYAHAGTYPFQGEIALLTRNVLFKTQLLGTSEELQQSDVRERKFAHTMYSPNASGNLQYAEFKYMGHYGVLSRYAIHFHRMLETSPGKIVRGTSGWYNGFRCVNVHASHEILIEDNVCFSSSSTSYMVELDPVNRGGIGDNLDNVFVHNIGIGMKPRHFDNCNTLYFSNFLEDQNLAVILLTIEQGGLGTLEDTVGECGREAVDFWPGVTNNEAFLGNVAAGDDGRGSQGFHFPEIRVNDLGNGGKIPWTFVANEAHSKSGSGIHTWQNLVPSRDLVDALLWKNGNSGILWGADNQRNKFYNAQLLENGEYGLEIFSVNAFIQDSIISGSTADGSEEAVGFNIGAYVVAQTPTTPVWIVRNTFKNLKTAGISQTHVACPDNSEHAKMPVNNQCSATYVIIGGNGFDNVNISLDFGWGANANAFWKVLDWTGQEVGNSDFVLLRKDQSDKGSQGLIASKLVNSATFYSPEFDALVTPLSSLPHTIEFTDLPQNNPDDRPLNYTFSTVADYPPEITLEVNMHGTVATLKANATDDNQVTRVEFFVDWIKIGTRTSAPYEVTVDLADLPSDGTAIPKRKYAYLYARALDGTEQIQGYEQRAYSNIVMVGPEVLNADQ